jgi:plastocyanin
MAIRARDKAFEPNEVTVKAGEVITFVFENEDEGVEHNLSVSVDEAGSETCTGPCAGRVTFSVPEPGTQVYFCIIHPGMFGLINVE